jgi:ABC-type uncharacterized transport system permease subunit
VALRKAINPFYAALLPVGVLFVITACAYVVMIVHGRDPQRAAETGLVALLAERGDMIMVVELVILGVLTALAIASDDFWMRRFGAKGGEGGP